MFQKSNVSANNAETKPKTNANVKPKNKANDEKTKKSNALKDSKNINVNAKNVKNEQNPKDKSKKKGKENVESKADFSDEEGEFLSSVTYLSLDIFRTECNFCYRWLGADIAQEKS